MGLAQAHPNYRWFPIRITSSHTVYLSIYLFLIFFIHFFQISRELSIPPQDAHSKVKDWKLGRLNHVAIAVPDLEKATQLYRDMLGADVSDVVVSSLVPRPSLSMFLLLLGIY